MLTIDELFQLGGLVPQGPVAWKEPIEHRGPGVYVVSIAGGAEPLLDALTPTELDRWIAGQAIVYIGRSKNLRRRLREFYQHTYGQKRPHKGGEPLLQLKNCSLLVSWAAADDYAGAEHRLITAFETKLARKPFANRMRAARVSSARCAASGQTEV